MNVAVAGAFERRNTLPSPPAPQRRTTKSAVSLQPPKCDHPEKWSVMASEWPAQLSQPNREISGNFAQRATHSAVGTPRSSAIGNVGVIGDGRYEASSQQKNRRQGPRQTGADGQSPCQKTAFLTSLVQPDIQICSTSLETDKYDAGDSSISRCKDLGMLSAPVHKSTLLALRSQSFNNSHAGASDSDSKASTRISKQVVPLTASLIEHQLEETNQQLTPESRPSPASSIMNSSLPPLWKRGGPSSTNIR